MTFNLAKDSNTLCVAVVAVHLEKEDKCVRPEKGKERKTDQEMQDVSQTFKYPHI